MHGRCAGMAGYARRELAQEKSRERRCAACRVCIVKPILRRAQPAVGAVVVTKLFRTPERGVPSWRYLAGVLVRNQERLSTGKTLQSCKTPIASAPPVGSWLAKGYSTKKSASGKTQWHWAENLPHKSFAREYTEQRGRARIVCPTDRLSRFSGSTA